MRLKGFFLVVGTVFLVACASNPIVPTTVNSEQATAVNTPEVLKVEAFRVKWMNNQNFEVRLHRTVPAVLSAAAAFVAEASGAWRTSLPPTSKDDFPPIVHELGEAYYVNLRGAYGQRVADLLTKTLTAKGKHVGSEMEITITPLYGQQSVDGWGSNMLLRTVMTSLADGKSSTVDVLFESGIHWTGVHNAAKPGEKEVAQFVDKLVRFLGESKAL